MYIRRFFTRRGKVQDPGELQVDDLPIFINYRRSDTQEEAIRLRRELEEVYGQRIFLDINSVGPGEWPLSIRNALKSSKVVISIMGDAWLDAKLESSGQRRLDDPKDWVRAELVSALETQKPIIPVYVRDTEHFEVGKLPKDIQKILDFQAFPMRPAPHWRKDFRNLCSALESLCPALQKEKSNKPPTESPKAILLKGFSVYDAVLSNMDNAQDDRFLKFQKWVRGLQEQLKEFGISIRSDVEERGRDNESKIAERIQSIDEADYVLMLCTPEYKEQYDNDKGEPGIDAEAISRAVKRRQAPIKVLPIILKGDKNRSVPEFFSNLSTFELLVGKETQFDQCIYTLQDLLFDKIPFPRQNFVSFIAEPNPDIEAPIKPIKSIESGSQEPELLPVLQMKQVNRHQQWQAYIDARDQQMAVFLLHGGRKQSLELFVQRLRTDLGRTIGCDFKQVQVQLPTEKVLWPSTSEEWIRLVAKQMNEPGEPLDAIKQAHFDSHLSIVIGPIQAEALQPDEPSKTAESLFFGLKDLMTRGFCDVGRYIKQGEKPSENKLWWTVFVEYKSRKMSKSMRVTLENRLGAAGLKSGMHTEILPDVNLPDWKHDVLPFLNRFELSEQHIKEIKKRYDRLDSRWFSQDKELAEFARYLEKELQLR